MTRLDIQIETMTLGEIASQIPGATAVFRNYALDFCCAGNRPFGEAVSQKGLDSKLIIRELENLSDHSDKGAIPSPAEMDDHSLIEFIVSRYHNVHRQQFPELINLASKVEKVHAAHPLCPKGLADHLYTMFAELSSHMVKEESVLFPLLLGNNRRLSAGPIAMIEREHEQHGRSLFEIRKLTHNGELPDTACNTWRALYRGLSQLEEDLMQHIHIENNILFLR